MCLIYTSSKGHSFSEAWLASFVEANPDGVGLMYAEKGELIVRKFTPTKAKPSRLPALLQLTKELHNKDYAVHLRFATHGEISDDNTHPYTLLEKHVHGIDMKIMHNGVLSDYTKDTKVYSDTYNYVQQILKPILAKNPDLIVEPAFQKMVGEHIDNNRFLIMDSLGRMVIINKHQGTEFQQEWLSNEYSWPAHSRHLDSPDTYPSYPTYWSNRNFVYARPPVDFDQEDLLEPNVSLLGSGTELVSSRVSEQDESNYYTTLRAQDLGKLTYYELEELCYEDPNKATELLIELIQKVEEYETSLGLVGWE